MCYGGFLGERGGKEMLMFNNFLYNCIKLLPMPEYLKQILEHATSQGYRSNVLKPLYGICIILFLAAIASFYFKAEAMAYICLCFAFLIVLSFLFCYFYCLFKNPDLLRSERFNLEKTALERVNQSGDSFSGKIKLPEKDFIVYKEISKKNSNFIDKGGKA